MTFALPSQQHLRVRLLHAPLLPPVFLGIALAAAYCAGCAWLAGERADLWRVSLPWAVAVTVPWALALALARGLAIRRRMGSAGRTTTELGIAVLLASAAWCASGLLEALLLPYGMRSAVLASYERLPLIVPAALVLAWVLFRRESPPAAAAPSPSGLSVDASPGPIVGSASAGVEVRAGDGATHFVRWSEVLAVEAAGNYVELVTNARRWLVRRPLQSMEIELRSLGAPSFERVHRGALVNTSAVQALQSKPDGGGVVVLSNGHEVQASRRRWPELRLRLRSQSRCTQPAPPG